MELLAILAILCFLSATIWYCILKAWPNALVAAGFTLLMLASHSPLPLT